MAVGLGQVVLVLGLAATAALMLVAIKLTQTALISIQWLITHGESMSGMIIPNVDIPRPVSIADAIQQWQQIGASNQHQKLMEMKANQMQQEQARQDQLRGAFASGRPSADQLYSLDPEFAANYEKQQGQIQSQQQEYDEKKHVALKNLATDALTKLEQSGIQDPQQAQEFLSQYQHNMKPYIQRVLGLPGDADMSLEQVKALAVSTPGQAQQQHIQSKVAEQQALMPGQIQLAQEQHRLSQQDADAREQATFDRQLKLEQYKNSQPKPISEYQQFQMDEKKKKTIYDAKEALDNIDETIGEFENLKAIQDRTTTGPYAGSSAAVAIRKALPSSIGGGDDLQRLEKGYNTMAVKAIGAFKAGGVSFGQLSNAEGQWIKSTQASLDAGKEINQEVLQHGLDLLNARKQRIQSELGRETQQQPTAKVPDYQAGQFKTPQEVKNAVKAGSLTKEQAKSILVNQFGFQ
jgi:hypothetical protein